MAVSIGFFEIVDHLKLDALPGEVLPVLALEDEKVFLNSNAPHIELKKHSFN